MDEDTPAELTTEAPVLPDPSAYEEEPRGPLNVGLLIVLVVIVAAVAVQNLWLRKKPLGEGDTKDD